MKQCSKCGERKVLSAFKTDRRKADGKAVCCKACSAAANVSWRKRNPDAEKNRGPRKPYVRDLAKQKVISARWRAKNAEQHRQNDKAWRTANPEKAKAIKANRRARKSGVGGSHTGEQIERLLLTQKYKCADCRTSIRKSFHKDHIKPIALGGSNDIRNIQLLCPKCNLSKHSKHPIDWARQNGRLL